MGAEPRRWTLWNGSATSYNQARHARVTDATDALMAPSEHVEVVEAQPIEALVAEQAEDEALWCMDVPIAEAYLQQELRRLHALIEGEHNETN